MGCRAHVEIGRFAKVSELASIELERCCLLSRKATAALQMQVAALTGRQGTRRPSREGYRLDIKAANLLGLALRRRASVCRTFHLMSNRFLAPHALLI